jgi:hypothetical protein
MEKAPRAFTLLMLAAMRRAPSRVRSLAAARRPGWSSKMDVSERLPVSVADDKALD